MKRPIVRYHGGKWLMADWIIRHFPAHRVYTETFGGAGSVLLAKPRAYAEVYNDLSGEMVNLFRVARDHGEKLKQQLYLTPYAREEFNLSYEKTDDPVEWARRTIVRGFLGFGSTAVLGNPSGFSPCTSDTNVPARSWKTYAEGFDSFINRLRGVVIENRPAVDVMQYHDGTDTLHYVDPPYVFSTRGQQAGNIKHAYQFEMSDDDHVELAAALHNLKGMVVLSGYESPLYDELFRDWQRVEKKVMADGARPRVEVLWLSNNIEIKKTAVQESMI